MTDDHDTDPDNGDDDIPDEVKQQLDPHEQEVYRDAYQTARGEGQTRKESHSVAMETLRKDWDRAQDDFEFFKG